MGVRNPTPMIRAVVESPLGSGSRVDLLRLGPALPRGWPETQTSCLTSLISPPGPGLPGLHAPAEAIYHSQVLEHHSWLFKPRCPVTWPGSSAGKGEPRVWLLPSRDLGTATLLYLRAACFCLGGLEPSSQFPLCSHPHSSPSRVLFFLCVDTSWARDQP